MKLTDKEKTKLQRQVKAIEKEVARMNRVMTLYTADHQRDGWISREIAKDSEAISEINKRLEASAKEPA